MIVKLSEGDYVGMTEEIKDEIIRHVIYRHMEQIMRILKYCDDTNVIFQIGMEMGYMHRSLSDELSKIMADPTATNGDNNQHNAPAA